MTGQRVMGDVRLTVEIGLWRHGWGLLVVGALWLAIVSTYSLCLLWHQEEADAKQRVLELSGEVAAARNRAPSAPTNSPEQNRLNSLRSAVYSEGTVTPLVREVLAKATQHGLVSKEAEFRVTSQGFSGLQQRQIILPLRGTYTALRSYVIDVLRDHPGLSVDQVQLKRAGVSQGSPDILVRMSIWVDPTKHEAPAQEQQGNAQ